MMIQKLPVSEQLSLVHDPSQNEGKTSGMAKGLFLRYRDEVYAGESSGFGLPVCKTTHQTFFPTLVSAGWLERNVFEKVYRLERVVRWYLFGTPMPMIFSAALEKLARFYMRQPECQQFLLKVRNILFALLRMKSVMVRRDSQGCCRVTYETGPEKLMITVDGRSLADNGELILLNEVAGLPFSRLRFGQDILEGENIPAWLPCPFSTILENPVTGIGFSISPSEPHAPLHWRLEGGREVGHGLNWAGLELTVDRQLFSYIINFIPSNRPDERSRFTASQPCSPFSSGPRLCRPALPGDPRLRG